MIDLFGIGFIAGLALAIPVGPMALLLIQTTIQKGLAAGLSGGLGMASVDFAYAVAVFSIGGAIASFLGSWGTLVSWIGAAILAVLGLLTVRNNWIQKSITELVTEPQSTSALRSYLKFVLATLVNPPTALYFLALSASLAGKLATPGQSVAAFLSSALIFGLGVFLGSGIWQEALVLSASALRKFLTPTARRWIGVFSGILITSLAVRMVVGS